MRFYELLGFTKTVGPVGPEPVAILDHPSGLEINLVLNAPDADEPNVLMDVPAKHPGITTSPSSARTSWPPRRASRRPGSPSPAGRCASRRRRRGSSCAIRTAT